MSNFKIRKKEYLEVFASDFSGDIKSKTQAGYYFSENDSTWKLDKNISINVSKIYNCLHPDLQKSFIQTLAYYAKNKSAGHTFNIFQRFSTMLKMTKCNIINKEMLISYRAMLDRSTEWHIGTVRGFIYKWYDLGYP